MLAPNDEPCFDFFWRPEESRDWECDVLMWIPEGGTYTPTTQIRAGNEFNPQLTRSDPLRHLAVTGIDWGLSMREPVDLDDVDFDTTTAVIPDPTCNISVPHLAQKVFRLAKTQARKFGSRIDPSYEPELIHQLERIRELGIESYNTHIGEMTGTPTTRPTDTDIFLGLHLDTDSTETDYNTARLFGGSGVPALLLALVTPINDALMQDEFSLWKKDPNNNYLPYSPLTFPGSSFELSYVQCDPTFGIPCPDPIKMLAWTALTGYRSYSDYTAMDYPFHAQSVLFPYPSCTYPGISGGVMNIAAVHHSLLFALLYDYTTDYTFPSYEYWNDPTADPFYHALPNSITACVPWMVGKTSIVDSGCCQGAALGLCHEYVNPWDPASLCNYTFPLTLPF